MALAGASETAWGAMHNLPDNQGDSKALLEPEAQRQGHNENIVALAMPLDGASETAWGATQKRQQSPAPANGRPKEPPTTAKQTARDTQENNQKNRQENCPGDGQGSAS